MSEDQAYVLIPAEDFLPCTRIELKRYAFNSFLNLGWRSSVGRKTSGSQSDDLLADGARRAPYLSTFDPDLGICPL